jgi:3'(2'), 5'-bisphosphate nucleotidase
MDNPQMKHNNDLLLLAVKASLKAGEAISEVYNSNNFEVEIKSDNSPLTRADKAAHQVIVEALQSSGLPVLSEESKLLDFKERKTWKKFWLVDPLDGTKEFIKRNGEFTVNIALIENETPILGVVYAPIPDLLYYGELSLGAFRLAGASAIDFTMHTLVETGEKLPVNGQSQYGIVASRSHLNPETANFIDGLKRKYPDARIVSKGSSLKLCMIAEGEADVYPRFAPTSEWDTAAGHAIIHASGGKVLQANSQEPLKYNKQDILNPWFIAMRAPEN